MIIINNIPKYYYAGYWQITSFCSLTIYQDNYNNLYKVIVTERNDNSGTSITNMIESLCTKIYNEFLIGIPKHEIIWLEHYDYFNKNSYDLVKFNWNEEEKCFEKPQWKRIDQANIKDLK